MTLPRRAEAPPSGIPSWARVGAKVVCVDTLSHWGTEGKNPTLEVEYRKIYTIRATGFDQWDDDPVAYLKEIVREPDDLGERGFDLRRFRPLISKSQSEDIAEFRKLLTGQPVRENERA